jgi:hypothetical protein
MTERIDEKEEPEKKEPGEMQTLIPEPPKAGNFL